jgi:hypothetical protein
MNPVMAERPNDEEVLGLTSQLEYVGAVVLGDDAFTLGRSVRTRRRMIGFPRSQFKGPQDTLPSPIFLVIVICRSSMQVTGLSNLGKRMRKLYVEPSRPVLYRFHN